MHERPTGRQVSYTHNAGILWALTPTVPSRCEVRGTSPARPLWATTQAGTPGTLSLTLRPLEARTRTRAVYTENYALCGHNTN
ncbi:unnamed protein product [Arctia plantaginis]|uniref:Uncharacterized protein n=1 Tax=Arctia plantaginis TaxID=874455 RepID=A0A8S1AN40_ARCPL|nr:unnamed protein product [Arctia plantaginis]